jgi:hypothetical protein
VGATFLILLATTASAAAAPGAGDGAKTSSPAGSASNLTTGIQSVGAGVSPGTASIVPTVPVGTGGPIRFLLVGDSEAAFLAFGLGPGSPSYDVDYAGDGVINCGLLHQGPVMFRGKLADTSEGFREGKHPVLCSTQLERWKNDVDAFHPDVVALEEGELETRSHLIDGAWVHLGERSLDSLELHALDQAVKVLGSTGAEVVLLTAPYYKQSPQPDGRPWPEDNPALVNSFNKLLGEVAASHPGRVVLEQLGRRLDPDGSYTAVIDGQQMRLDGVHVSPAAGRWVQPWLLPRIVALGEQARARSSVPTTTPTSSTAEPTPPTAVPTSSTASG